MSRFTPILTRAKSAVVEFLTKPASAKPLAALRIGVASILLLQTLAVAGSLTDLYGARGIMQWMDTPLNEGVPRMVWFTDAAARIGINEAVGLRVVFLTYVASLACLLIGWHTRIAAVFAWLLQMTLMHTATTTAYGVDSFAHIILFYCMFMPVGHAWSYDQSTRRVSGEPTAWARLSIRMFQLHLCLVYLITGLEKAAGWDWWNGEAIWCALMRRDLCPFDMSWVAAYPWIPMLLGWGTLVIEIGYVAFMWPRQTRTLGALATISLHLGIGIFMNLWAFSGVMICMTGSMFLVSAEPGPAFSFSREWAMLKSLFRPAKKLQRVVVRVYES